jgi:hypothetical protein
MDGESDEDEENQKPKYSMILSEEEYEDEDGPESYEQSPLQENFENPDPSPEIEGWDPREAHDFFRIQY